MSVTEVHAFAVDTLISVFGVIFCVVPSQMPIVKNKLGLCVKIETFFYEYRYSFKLTSDIPI